MSLNKNNFLFLIITLPILTFSQTESVDSLSIHQLDEVFVTATRTLRKLSQITTPSTVISSKELRQINAVRLSDVLEEQAGLVLVPDFGGGQGIQMQGLDSQYVLILIDGQPLIGRQAGTLDLNRITVNAIKQIEIVKGASSSLYGNEALGGVINIITETPKEGIHARSGVRYGTFDSADLSTYIGLNTKKISSSIAVNHNTHKGFNLSESSTIPTVQPYRNTTLNISLGYEFNTRHNLMLTQRNFNEIQENNLSDQTQGESEILEYNNTLKYEYSPTKTLKVITELYQTRFKTKETFWYSEATTDFDQNQFNQFLFRPETRVIYTPNQNSEWVFGVGTTHESLIRDDFYEDPIFNAPYVFIQLDKKIGNRTQMLFGARYDNHNAYQSQLSPKFSLRHNLSEQFHIKGSIGYGFKAPDFRQLYFDFSNSTLGYTVLGFNAVNSRLKQLEQANELVAITANLSDFEGQLNPESSIGINLGIGYQKSDFKGSINLFRNQISNLIDTQVVARKTNGQNVFSYYNISSVFTKGLELDAKYDFTNEFSVNVGGQYLIAKSNEVITQIEQGQVFTRPSAGVSAIKLNKNDYFGLPNRSRIMGNLKLYYQPIDSNLDANLRLVYRSRFALFDTNGNGFIDEYDPFASGFATVDLAINKRIKGTTTISVGCDNLFDYTDPTFITNLPGRLIYTQLTLNL